MEENTDWKKVTMICPNCGKKIIGYRSKDDKVKFSCPNCKTVMIRTYKNKSIYIRILPMAK